MYMLSNTRSPLMVSHSQPNKSGGVHWYKYFGTYLFVMGIAFTSIFLISSRSYSAWNSSSWIVINIGTIGSMIFPVLMIIGILYIIGPLIFHLRVRNHSFHPYNTNRIWNLFILEILGLGFSGLLFESISSFISYQTYYPPYYWSIFQSDARALFIMWLILFALYITAGFVYRKFFAKKISPIEASYNQTLPQQPNTIDGSSYLSKSSSQDLRTQTEVGQESTVSQSNESYTYADFIAMLTQKLELQRFGHLFFYALGLYLIFLGVLVWVNNRNYSSLYGLWYGLWFITASVLLFLGIALFLIHQYKLEPFPRVSFLKRVYSIKGLFLFSLAFFVATLYYLIQLKTYNNYFYGLTPIMIDLMWWTLLFLGLKSYQYRSSFRFRFSQLKGLMLERLGLKRLHKHPLAVELTKRFLLLQLESLRTELKHASPLTIDNTIQDTIQADLFRLEHLFKVNNIRNYSSATLLQFCMDLLHPIYSNIKTALVNSYTDQLLETKTQFEDVQIDTDMIWQQMNKQLTQWQSEFQSP